MVCNNATPFNPSLVLAVLCLVLAGCGGGGSDRPSVAPGMPTAPVLTNFQQVVVQGGPTNGVNLPYTSVTICPPDGSSACQVIDNVLVDTASTGFRVLSSVLPPAFRLPQQAAGDGISALVECTQFADGYSWGPVKAATIVLAGETLRDVPIQVIGDPAFPNVPTDCSSSGPSENTVLEFGSNAILGVGSFIHDCGQACAQRAIPGTYYACSVVGCTPTRVDVEQQVRHPVTMLAKNNNGVVLRLPAVPQEGALTATGTLFFGIGTESNNGLGEATVYTVDPFTATLSASINGLIYPNSFLDSGSNGLFFPSRSIPVCRSGFYCPATPQTVISTLQGQNGNRASVDFVIGNADALFRNNPTFAVQPTLGAPAFGLNAVDFGLPFFFGKTVFTAIEGQPTPGGTGPYVAF
ncbi:MAG: DUF3443 domain-containing protein [Pseudomonadota bacterium]